MSKLFYTLAARYGNTDRTRIADLFVASLFGLSMVMHIAPDGKATTDWLRGGIDVARAKSEETQKAGLATWAARASSQDLERTLRLAYDAMQHKLTAEARQQAAKMYEIVVTEMWRRTLHVIAAA